MVRTIGDPLTQQRLLLAEEARTLRTLNASGEAGCSLGTQASRFAQRVDEGLSDGARAQLGLPPLTKGHWTLIVESRIAQVEAELRIAAIDPAAFAQKKAA